jgi:hypothetical protein
MRMLVLCLLIGCAEQSTPSAKAPAAPSTSASMSPTTRASDAPGPTNTNAPDAPATPMTSGDSTAGGSVLVGEIPKIKSFDPKATLEELKPELLACYQQARATNPNLHGKLKLRIVLNEAGRVLGVDAEPDGPANAATLVGCIRDSLEAKAQFSNPGGSATVIAPLVFRR